MQLRWHPRALGLPFVGKTRSSKFGVSVTLENGSYSKSRTFSVCLTNFNISDYEACRGCVWANVSIFMLKCIIKIMKKIILNVADKYNLSKRFRIIFIGWKLPICQKAVKFCKNNLPVPPKWLLNELMHVCYITWDYEGDCHGFSESVMCECFSSPFWNSICHLAKLSLSLIHSSQHVVHKISWSSLSVPSSFGIIIILYRHFMSNHSMQKYIFI